MPWNDNANPGPWGAPPDGRPGAPRPPDLPPRADGLKDGPRRRLPPPLPPGQNLREIVQRLADELRRWLEDPRRGGPRPKALAVIAAIVALAWILTGFYTVQANEEAVVTRFGGYARSEGPGLHYHLPAPIERVEKVAVTNQNKLLVGGAPGAPAPDESLMLTGDENIVDISFAVQWHVNDAAAYLFQIREPQAAVKAVAESAMREVVGHSALTPILTNGRGEVQAQTLALMQRILDFYHSGVTVDAVQIQNANPPAEVVAAYQDIARAGQDAQSYINEANTYRNRVVNEAKGTASKITQAAEGYKAQTVLEAQGQAARFDQVYAQYRLAPAVTRERLYIQTMQTVLAKSKKVIVDAKGATAPIILPPDAFKPRTVEPSEAQPAPPAPAQASAAGAQQ